MDDLPKVLVELEAQYQERRYAFLDAAFKICWVALDWSAVQLDLGNIDLALAEVRNVDQSRDTIWRFLSQLKDDAHRARCEAELSHLEKALLLLKAETGFAAEEVAGNSAATPVASTQPQRPSPNRERRAKQGRP
jgi:hypothetical protein